MNSEGTFASLDREKCLWKYGVLKNKIDEGSIGGFVILQSQDNWWVLNNNWAVK